MDTAKFTIGQVIHHLHFDYRGVIIDIDPVFMGSEEWYQQVALSRPPKDKPWYHVLVDGYEQYTYVAEQNLEIERGTVQHSRLSHYLDYRDGYYYPKQKAN